MVRLTLRKQLAPATSGAGASVSGGLHSTPDPFDDFGMIKSQSAPAQRLTRRGPPA